MLTILLTIRAETQILPPKLRVDAEHIFRVDSDTNQWIRHLWRIRECEPEEANCLIFKDFQHLQTGSVPGSFWPDYSTGHHPPGLFRVVIFIVRVRIRWRDECQLVRDGLDTSTVLESRHSAAFFNLKVRNLDVYRFGVKCRSGLKGQIRSLIPFRIRIFLCYQSEGGRADPQV